MDWGRTYHLEATIQLGAELCNISLGPHSFSSALLPDEET